MPWKNLKKPFEKAEELKAKVLRLAELNKLLDMGEVEEQENTNPLLEDVKKAIIDFVNREYGEEHEYKEFCFFVSGFKACWYFLYRNAGRKACNTI